MPQLDSEERLRKELGLGDVFAISTGAMFSSGFFLLPGIAAASAGPAVVLAYLLAGLLILPAMLSMAELSTAMPRAGGAYYFLDRSLGPVVGTVGGLGTWIALVFKSAFALLGIGAYLTLLAEIPVQEVTLLLTVAFVFLNIVGAKETTRLQQILVWLLLSVVLGFVILGLGWTVQEGPARVATNQFTPFLPFGVEGLVSTVGLVFVSYAGLTKVASVAEEVENPDRNIPLGMILSLATATAAYVLGVFVMVAVLDPTALRSDLTPVATAASGLLDGVAGTIAVSLVAMAAFAAFASTGNAGIMSASRYLLAMARDNHLWESLSRLGRFQTPTFALLVTGGAMVLSILTFDVEAVAKLASAFQLLIFALVNLAVIVMRESWIEAYEPGFRSPFYPWLHAIGFLVPFGLIAQMGWLAMLFILGVTAAGIAWYHVYVREHLVREGAIYHVFERLGRNRYHGLDRELREILEEKGVREMDPFSEVVAGAYVLDLRERLSFETVAEEATRLLAGELPQSADELLDGFAKGTRAGYTAISRNVALPHLRVDDAPGSRMVMVRSRAGIAVPSGPDEETVQALFFLVSPRSHPGRHLRILAQLAGRVEEETFEEEWLTARSAEELKGALLQERTILTIRIREEGKSRELAGRAIRDIGLPEGVLVALIRRRDQAVFPSGSTNLELDDVVTFIGLTEGLAVLRRRFGAVRAASSPDTSDASDAARREGSSAPQKDAEEKDAEEKEEGAEVKERS